MAGTGKRSKRAARQGRRTAVREERGQGGQPPETTAPEQLAEAARRLRERDGSTPPPAE